MFMGMRRRGDGFGIGTKVGKDGQKRAGTVPRPYEEGIPLTLALSPQGRGEGIRGTAYGITGRSM